MKSVAILFYALLLCIAIASCGFPNGSISIKHSQYSHYYEMTAKFNRDKTTEVDKWLDKGLSTGNTSFVNTSMDGDYTGR